MRPSKKTGASPRLEKRPRPSQYRSAARKIWKRPGEIEIDDDAEVSESEDGAYVQAWVWIDRNEASGKNVLRTR